MSSLRKRVSTDDFELIDRDDWQCDGGSAEGVGQQLDGGSDCFSEPDNTFSKLPTEEDVIVLSDDSDSETEIFEAEEDVAAELDVRPSMGLAEAAHEEDVQGKKESCLRRRAPVVASPESLETALLAQVERRDKRSGASPEPVPVCSLSDTVFDRRLKVVVVPFVVFMLLQLTLIHYLKGYNGRGPGGPELESQLVALSAVQNFSMKRALVPALGSELCVLHYQTAVTERLIDARSLFKRDVPKAAGRAAQRKVRREVKRALKAMGQDMQKAGACFQELGRLLHHALSLDRSILLHLTDHLREAYLALMDQDAAGADVHAGLLMVPVAGFETALAHVVSTYSAAAKELAGICSDLGSQVENAAMTPADLRRREIVGAAQEALCVPQLEALAHGTSGVTAEGPRIGCGHAPPACNNPDMDQVLERLLSSRDLYHALLGALGANTTALLEKSASIIALPPARAPAPLTQERRGVPLFSFPVVYSNFITALQAEGILD